MKITIESTSKIVDLVVDGHDVSARVWEGISEAGVPVICFITLITADVALTDPRVDELLAEFTRDLESVRAPTPAAQTIPLRLIL
jgi:hypothetical protein